MRPARHDPGNGKLGRGDALLLRNRLGRVHERHVVVERLLLEAGEHVAHIPSREVLRALDGPRQEATPERPDFMGVV